MPTRNPKPKEKRRIKIPYELQDGMRELFQRIEDAKHDQDEDFSYDDALQAPGITEKLTMALTSTRNRN